MHGIAWWSGLYHGWWVKSSTKSPRILPWRLIRRESHSSRESKHRSLARMVNHTREPVFHDALSEPPSAHGVVPRAPALVSAFEFFKGVDHSVSLFRARPTMQSPTLPEPSWRDGTMPKGLLHRPQTIGTDPPDRCCSVPYNCGRIMAKSLFSPVRPIVAVSMLHTRSHTRHAGVMNAPARSKTHATIRYGRLLHTSNTRLSIVECQSCVPYSALHTSRLAGGTE